MTTTDPSVWQSVRVHADSFITRNDELMSAPVDDEVVFLNPATGNYVALDAIGRRVWELLEAPTTLTSLVDYLVEEFNGDRDDIKTDVVTFLDDLVTEGMVCVDDRPPA